MRWRSNQDLLRDVGVWTVPPGLPLVTMKNMAQILLDKPHRKSGPEHPKPAGSAVFANGLHPGVAPSGEDALRKDPRTPVRSGDLGRGLYRRNAPAQQRHAHLQPAGVSRGQGIHRAGRRVFARRHDLLPRIKNKAPHPVIGCGAW